MRRLLNTSLKLLVSCGLIFYLTRQIDLEGLGTAFVHLRLWLAAAAVMSFVLSNFLGAVQWYLLLRAQGLEISFRQALVFYHVGVFFNNVLLGNIGGDALRIYDVQRLTGAASAGVAATFMDRFIGLFSTCSLALAAYPLIAHTQGVWLTSVLVPVWLGLIALASVGLSRRLGGFLEDRILPFLPQRLGDLGRHLRGRIVVYRHRGRLLLGIWTISLTVQFCRILVYFLAGLALGMAPGLLYFVCFQPVAAVLAALPVSVGGLGVRENTLVTLFRSVGIQQEVSTAMSLLGYLTGIVASLVGGVAFVLRRVHRGPAPSAGVAEHASDTPPPGH